MVCEPEVRFRLLYTFLKKNSAKKIIVFLSSCASVTYHEELLNYIDLPVLSLHGKQKQARRARTFFEFNNMEKGCATGVRLEFIWMNRVRLSKCEFWLLPSHLPVF